MTSKHFRTHATGLIDDELLLLDVMFDTSVVFPMLRQCNIGQSCNVKPHSLNDDSLKDTLQRLQREDIVKRIDLRHGRRQYLAITEYGASLWASERCPIWERYCQDTERGAARDKTIMAVLAVSPNIRDDYLRIAIQNPIRIKRTKMHDTGLIHWKSFEHLHVGLVSFYDPKSMPAAEYVTRILNRQDHLMLVKRERERERTWWQNLGELQKFVGTIEAP